MSDWFTHMRRGDFAAAWAISDAVLASRAGVPSWHLEREYQWIWDGTPLAGRRVLIRCYHGLGDTIQFARFFPLVNAMAKECTVWAQPSLIPLLQTMRGIGRLLPLHDGTPEVEYDVDVESMELTHLFRTTVDTIPNEMPYFDVTEDRQPRLSRSKLNVGVVWRAGDWGPQRSIPIDTLARLFDLPNVAFYSLQRGERDPRLLTLDGVDEPLSTARVMRALDLVVTVDTMTAHLAGALAVPVFTLLAHEHDWRWMDERRDSPWYPTMRLFRQPRPGDWESVVDEVRYAVRAMPDETKKDSLNDWGIDVDKFKERAKESLDAAKGDLSEIGGTLRQALVNAREVVLGLQTNGAPAAQELKAGFERAWKEIENAFRS
ncbi:MAG TPA: hypothetical protein VE010_20540, partial [Thermoanaerobaculia bacterium]|nr:hypothetical protein [Thermoanaerobaculia bacterium]